MSHDDATNTPPTADRDPEPNAAVGSTDAMGTPPGKPRRRRGNGGQPPKGPKPPRASNAEVNERVSVVMGMIVDGICRRRPILRTLAKAHLEGKLSWGPKLGAAAYDRPDDAKFQAECVSVRTVDIYIARATAELQQIADEPRAIAKSKARARYEKALAGAVQNKQWDTVRKVTRDMVRLDGLEPANFRVTHDGTVNTNVSGQVEHVHRSGGTVEDRAAAVAELFGRAIARRTQAAAAASN